MFSSRLFISYSFRAAKQSIRNLLNYIFFVQILGQPSNFSCQLSLFCILNRNFISKNKSKTNFFQNFQINNFKLLIIVNVCLPWPYETVMFDLSSINYHLRTVAKTWIHHTSVNLMTSKACYIRSARGWTDWSKDKGNQGHSLGIQKLQLDGQSRNKKKITQRVAKLQQKKPEQEERKQIQYVNRGRPIYLSKKFKMIQKREQSLLMKGDELSKSIKNLISLGGSNLQMVSLYLFVRANRGLNSSNDQILFKFILIGYTEVDEGQIQRIKNTAQGVMYYCMVKVARRKLRSGLDYLYQTFDSQEWVQILQQQVGLQFRLSDFDQAVFQDIILLVLSNQDLFRLCRRIGKLTQILCLIKHLYFEMIIEPLTIANTLGLAEEESNIAKEIINEYQKIIAGTV